jgi:hypothetical protein
MIYTAPLASVDELVIERRTCDSSQFLLAVIPVSSVAAIVQLLPMDWLSSATCRQQALRNQ